MAWAAEQPPVPVAPPAPVIGQQGIVLGQADAQRPATAAPVTAPPAVPPTPAAPAVTAALPQEGKKPDAQTLFQESLRQMMPLDDSQIQEYRERSDQRERALLPVSPSLASRTARVSLEPGSAPVRVFTTANIATSLLIHDSTGQPWPITSVTNGGPSFFQVLRPELPDGNLLNITPIQAYGTTTLVVTMEKQDIPLVIRLESDSVHGPERKADALVLFQISQHEALRDIRICVDPEFTSREWLARIPGDVLPLRLPDPGSPPSALLHNVVYPDFKTQLWPREGHLLSRSAITVGDRVFGPLIMRESGADMPALARVSLISFRL